MKKNGKIEFYRFVFCISVLLFRDSAGYLTGRIKRIFPTHVVAYLIALFAYIISVSMSMNKTRLIARMILNVDEPER